MKPESSRNARSYKGQRRQQATCTRVNDVFVSVSLGLYSTHRHHVNQSGHDDSLGHKENTDIDVVGAENNYSHEEWW